MADLTLKFHKILQKRSDFKINSSFPMTTFHNSYFLKISTQIASKIEISKFNLLNLKEILSKSTFFDRNDNKINSKIIEIKEEISELQNAISTLEKTDHDYKFNKDAENISIKIFEIIELRILKITDDFQRVLKKRAEEIKLSEIKKQKLANASYLNRETEKTTFRNNKPLFLDRGDEEKEPVLKEKMEKVSFYNNRQETIKNIEKLLHEVGGIFQRLGAMVRLHDTLIDRIDGNTDKALENVKGAKTELIKHYENITNWKALCFKLILIILLFVVIYIILT